MRILVIATDFPPRDGGIATLLANVCSQLSQSNDVFVLTTWQDDYVAFDSRQSYQVWRDLSSNPGFFRRGVRSLISAVLKIRE